MPLDDHLRAAVKIARAAVVAEPAPELHHAFERRGGKRLEEALVIGNDGAHLGLLQHHLGQPDPIGVTVVLPGQIMPAEALLPGDDALGESDQCGHV